MIQVQNTSKKFALSKKQRKELQTEAGSLCAVSNVSFTCKPGSIFSLLGLNGAGKTTMLRMISTLLSLSCGTITVNGYDVGTQADQAHGSIGFLTGSTNLYDRLTPLETVKYFADLYLLPQPVFLARKSLLFEQLGINSFLSKRIGQLSTGMKQKVSIARTMIHDVVIKMFCVPSQMQRLYHQNFHFRRFFVRLNEKTVIYCYRVFAGNTLIMAGHRGTSVSAIKTTLYLEKWGCAFH